MKIRKHIMAASMAVIFLIGFVGNGAFAAEDLNLAAAKKIVQAFNQKDVSKYDKVYSTKLEYYGTGENAKTDLAGLKQFMSGVFAAFPDGKITIDELVAKGDDVFYRITFNGTQTGDMPGIPATGKKVQARSIGIFRFEDGKVVKEWENFDDLGMMQQLGAIPKSETGQQSQ